MRVIASAKASLLASGTSSPCRAGSMISRPAVSVAIAGNPAAMASSSPIESPAPDAG